MRNFFKTLFTGKVLVTMKSIFSTAGGFVTGLASSHIAGIPWYGNIAIGVVGFTFSYLAAHAFNTADAPPTPIDSEMKAK